MREKKILFTFLLLGITIMSGYSQFLEMSLDTWYYEVITFPNNEKVVAVLNDVERTDELHSALWLALSDCMEYEVFGELRENGKVILNMRKVGDYVYQF